MSARLDYLFVKSMGIREPIKVLGIRSELFNTVDAGYKHIVGNCINVLITGINYIGIYGNRFPI